MGTKSREVIYSGPGRATKMNADRARKLAAEAAREADRAEAPAGPGVWTLVDRQPSPTTAQCLNGGRGEVPQIGDVGQYSLIRCRPLPRETPIWSYSLCWPGLPNAGYSPPVHMIRSKP